MSQATKTIEAVIIGAGPAGLAAAAALRMHGTPPLIVEQGGVIRSRDDPMQISSGVGGAGLFSDGKWSYFPSATSLWNLSNTELLKKSEQWLYQLLMDHGIESPGVPATGRHDSTDGDCTSSMIEKIYPSTSSSVEQRQNLTDTLRELAGNNIETCRRARVVSIGPEGAILEVVGVNCNECTLIDCRVLIIATGRIGILFLGAAIPSRFRRLEVGVRIVDKSETFFLSSHSSLDPKIKFKIGEVEYRTFCCCRDGEVIFADLGGTLFASGRSDVDPTGRSNVGFNVRYSNASQAADPLTLIREFKTQRFSIDYRSLISGTRLYGGSIDADLSRGLRFIGQKYTAIQNSRLVGPTLEGVGYYPRIDNDLRIVGTNTWVAGDASGIFRGLTAAMISGYYSGLRGLSVLRSNRGCEES